MFVVVAGGFSDKEEDKGGTCNEGIYRVRSLSSFLSLPPLVVFLTIVTCRISLSS